MPRQSVVSFQEALSHVEENGGESGTSAAENPLEIGILFFKKSTTPQASRSGIHALVHAPVTVRYIATDLILPATQLTDDISLEKQVAFNLTVDATLSAGWRFY